MAYQVIARKWRPQTFSDLVGQEHVTNTLANAIKNNRVAHSYIFSGARGVGKTTAARILAKALNCVQGPTAEPCGVCDACKEIASGSSLDVIEIDAASNRGIDQIRELREMVRYAPAAARSKVVILDEAHMLTTEASNALLKTLEEPPERVIFVMATTEPEQLEDTIRSRSQHFHFRALTFQEIVDRLKHIASNEHLTIDDGALSVIARMAEGSMRDGLSLLEQARAYCGDNIQDEAVRELLGVVPEDTLREMVDAIAEQSAPRALGLVHRFQKEGRNLQHFCREAIRHIRNLLIARVCGADSDLIAATPDQRPGIAESAALFSEEDLTRFYQILLQTEDDLRRKPDPRVHLEMGLLRMVNAARLAPLEEMLSETHGGGGGSAPSNSGSGNKSAGVTSRGASAFGHKAESIAAPAVIAAVRPKPATFVPPAPTKPVPVTFASAAAAVAPALEKMNVEESVERRAQKIVGVSGLTAEQVAEIKKIIQSQQKFIGELLEHTSRWELDGSELRLYFSPDKSSFAGLIEGRDTIEKIRNASGKVLGQSVRVCARLENGSIDSTISSSAAIKPPDARAKFESDPIVKSMLQRFGGRISEVRKQTEE